MEAGTRPCGAGCGRSRPFDVPVAWSAGKVPVSFGSWPWPARERAAVHREAGAVRADRWSLQDSGPVGDAGPGRSPGRRVRAAVDPEWVQWPSPDRTSGWTGSRPTRGWRTEDNCLAIRFLVGCALIIPMIIQTIRLDPSGSVWIRLEPSGAVWIRLDPSGAVWTDGASNVSRPDPSGAVQVDAEHPSRNRKVAGRLSGKDARRELRGQIIPCLQGRGGAVRPSAAPAPAGAPGGW
jgi:hypothetical protein